jgi:putative oxidoreductase
VSSPDLLNAGLLLLRVFLGVVLGAHGVLKFIQGGGIEAEVALLEKDNLRGGRPAAAFSAFVQVGSGMLLAAGLLTPLAGAGALGAMVVAVCAKTRNGFWVQHDGLEFPLIFAVMTAVTILTGPGGWSLDQVAGLSPTSGESLLALGAGVVLGAVTFVVLHQARTTARST